MQVDISGQNALITGASRGIGRASALAFAKEGVNVAVTARNEEQLASLVEECEAMGVKALALPADATDHEAVFANVEKGIETFGHFDILVNNAGVAKYADVVDHTIDDYNWMMDTNMKSTFIFTRATLPQMIERKSGIVIFVSSQAGVAGFPGEAVYCATKHAQVGFAHALDGEVREKNIRVSIIEPGGVGTTFAFGTGREEGMPALDEMSRAETVADAIVFASKVPPQTRILEIGMRPMSEKLYGGA
ncbi:MAG: SDR family oxidoreductase [Chloroflexota bacterium]